MTRSVPELLIVSGGSEVVGLALAEAANAAAIPYAVFSLVRRSVLRGAPGCVAWADLAPRTDDWPRLRDAFLKALASLPRSRSSRLAILASEDGGLRLLNECRDDVLVFGEFPRARALRMGGVDKAEVVQLAEGLGGIEGLAPSIVLDDPSAAVAVMDRFGLDAIFKPALKPLDMDLSAMGRHGAKVITARDGRDAPGSVIARLRKAWPTSQRWIAQPRLRTGSGLERSVCAVRNINGLRACQVVERAKSPRMGGTAYWVSTEQRVDLVPAAVRLLEALDVIGVSELSYLPDASGNAQMIEFNPRPWLQIGLVERAGFRIVVDSVAVLRGDAELGTMPSVSVCDWVQPERVLQAWLTGQCSWSEIARMAPRAFDKATVLGGYACPFPGVRRRLVMRTLRRMLAVP